MMTAARRHADVGKALGRPPESWWPQLFHGNRLALGRAKPAIDRPAGRTGDGPRNRVPWWTATRCTNSPFVWARSRRVGTFLAVPTREWVGCRVSHAAVLCTDSCPVSSSSETLRWMD